METRAEYIGRMIARKEIAEEQRLERRVRRRERSQESSIAEPTERAKILEPEVVRPSLSVLACQNTIDVLTSMSDQPANRIRHGAVFTLVDMGAPTDLTKEARYLFIDPKEIPALRVVNGSYRALAMIPNGPVFISGDSPAGKNIIGMREDEERQYWDLTNTVRTVKVLEIR